MGYLILHERKIKALKNQINFKIYLLMKKTIIKRSIYSYLWCIAMIIGMLSPVIVQDAEAANNEVVSGTVSSAENEPLIGVSVTIKGTTKGTVTDAKGHYVINANRGDILVFSYIGYSKREITVKGSVLNVTMKEDSELLNEVVVVGYGTMKRSDLTGAVTSVTAEDMAKSVNTSLDQALQGRAAGIMVWWLCS